MRTLVVTILLAAAPALAAFEKGGVLDADPRSGALGGVMEPGSREAVASGVNPAGLALLTAPALATGGGVSSAASLAASGLSGGALVEGLGLGGGFTQVMGSGIAERTVRAAVGIPAEDLPGAAFGAAVKFRRAEYSGAHATGFGLDLGAVSPVPVPVEALAVTAAAGIEDVLGSLDWSGGLTEPVARQSRIGVSARWAGMLTALTEIRFIRAATRNEEVLGLGLEDAFQVREVALAVRAGWRNGSRREAAFTGGLGAGYGPVTIDYAVAQAGPAGGAIHLVSATWAFAGGESSAAPRFASSSSHRTAGAQGEAVPETDPVVFASPYSVARIQVHAPRVELVTGWTVLILDKAGSVVWSADGEGLPPLGLTWTGVALDGSPAPAGEYRCQLVLKGPGSFQYLSPGARFRIVRPLEPKSAADDDGPGGF